VGHAKRMAKMRNTYRILLGKLEGKRSLGRNRRRWKDNVRMDLRETAWEVVNRMNRPQHRDQW